MHVPLKLTLPLLLLATACGAPAPMASDAPMTSDVGDTTEETTEAVGEAGEVLASGEEVLISSEESLCLRAADHLQSCLELESPQVPGFCDPELAQWTLEQPCALLEREPSTYGWGISWNWLERLACNLGWVYYCKPEGCTQDKPLDICTDYREFDDCQMCEFYSCLETEQGLDCGGNGYFQGYGQKYCARFSAITNNFLSPAGREWLANVRVCLMDELEAIIDETDSCNAIRQGAFDSHPSCYVNSGLCSLPPSDWAQILATISPWDNDLKQMVVSGASCLQEWLQ